MTKENNKKSFWARFYSSYIPNKNDNAKQIVFKIVFIIAFVTFVVSAICLSVYFANSKKQADILDNTREVYEKIDTNEDGPSKYAELIAENPDFKGWITLSNTQIDNPIYQAKDNDYYLKRNHKGEKSVYGALYFDCENVITEEKTDNNLVIYGHEMKNGSMFGELKKLRKLDFYKANPTINFSTLYDTADYKIFAIFVLNAVPADDNNYMYNIYRKQFASEEDFKAWSDEAYERSLINTGVDVSRTDKIITLLTCSNDFNNSRLVVMARKVRPGESASVDTENAVLNPSPRYPERWYIKRGIKK